MGLSDDSVAHDDGSAVHDSGANDAAGSREEPQDAGASPDKGALPTITVVVRVDTSRYWRWQLALAAHIGTRHACRMLLVKPTSTAGTSVPLAVRIALSLEQSQPAFTLIDPRTAGALTIATGVPLTTAAFTANCADVIVDLATDGAIHDERMPTGTSTPRTLWPLYDGQPSEKAMWAALLRGRAPRLALLDTATGVAIDIGQPAIEAPHELGASAAGVVVRLIEGIGRVIGQPDAGALTEVGSPDVEVGARQPAGSAAPAVMIASMPPSLSDAAGFGTAKAAVRARRLLHRTLGPGSRWAIAWRWQTGAPDPIGDRTLALADYQLLPDDGQRYYADPFLFEHNGVVHCFVEELPFATERGVISVVTLGRDGRVSTPRPVLETAHHLSYPQVFARGGDIFMLPEQHQSGGLMLYRAARFPDIWEPVARLIDEPVHDASLFEHDGRLWITATCQGPASARWGSSWDALSLFVADDLLGPWRPHPRNPVLIDAGTARGAGPVVAEGGRLYRPVQDCRTGYGTAVEIHAITGLGPTAAATYRQRRVARLTFPEQLGLSGPHTWGRLVTAAGTIEVIDVCAPAALIEQHLDNQLRAA